MGSQGVTTVPLIRDGYRTPWGFRLHGGKDVGCPLTIQKVAFGTPADGELQAGDIVLAISGINATKMSHQDATDTIRRCGNHLVLQIHRQGGYYYCPSTLVKKPPTTVDRVDKFFDPLFRPLPSTYFPDEFRPYTPESFNSEEQYEYIFDKEREKRAIAHQPFRTNPLIVPQVKTRHDYPTGSYLRHEHGGHYQQRHTMGDRINDAMVMAKIQDSISSGSRTTTPDSAPSTLKKQYNSPINLYSNQNVADAYQSGVQPKAAQRHPQKIITPLKLYSQADMVKTPTYQIVHNEEWADLKKNELREHNPVQPNVYNLHSGEFPRRGDVAQSLSFKNLMYNVYCGDM